MKINQSKLERQKLAKRDMLEDLKKYGKSVLNAVPGFGKTFLITELFYKPAKEKQSNIRLFTLVGSDHLRKQWKLRDKGASIVETWQSMYKSEPIEVDVLVIDEIHSLILTEEYAKVLDVIKAKYVIGLSGTLDERHREALKQKGFKISHVVTKEEAVQNGWLNNEREYNIEVEMSWVDSKRYLELEDRYREAVLFIDENVDDPEKSKSFANFKVIADVQKWSLEGYVYLDGTVSKQYDKDKVKHYKTGKNAGKPYTSKKYYNAQFVANMRGVPVEVIIGKATEASRMYAQKTALVYSNLAKVQVVKDFVNMFPDRKIITFNKATNFCDTLEQECGGAAYHGKISEKNLSIIMDNFITDKVRMLHTVSKIKEGADIPGVDVAINCSYYSKWTEKFQKDARALRAEENKKDTIILNLYTVTNRAFGYIPTFEKWYLKKLQKGKEVQWIKNLQEIE